MHLDWYSNRLSWQLQIAVNLNDNSFRKPFSMHKIFTFKHKPFCCWCRKPFVDMWKQICYTFIVHYFHSAHKVLIKWWPCLSIYMFQIPGYSIYFDEMEFCTNNCNSTTAATFYEGTVYRCSILKWVKSSTSYEVQSSVMITFVWNVLQYGVYLIKYEEIMPL
jgi:hypothetical protein